LSRASRPRLAPVAPDLPNEPPACDHGEALSTELAAWREAVFGEGGAWEDVKPALEAVAGFAGRLDALCDWLKGKWPWIAAVAFLLIQRTVNMAPDDLPKLIAAIAKLGGDS
jgi:hypothetical protein